ncbi:hypothetical protein Acr_04g0004270 [Actinidia rufa]|uniref:Uncharacterized protein n=1 Tax=Actinidia rufa TaxID=165716 RepID=A0A7J0EIF8_9ERIC|nr:hypothetical protein Acr_04g0004270 [Actinidia rufa]
MSRTSDVTRSGDLDSLPSWISDHLGERISIMTDEINQSPSSPMEGSPEESPLIAVHPSVRLPDEGEIITCTRPGEVAFYEAAFPAGLCFPIHPTIRYSISLSEFRNLFSLNSNPKLDQGWLYFKARNKKVLLGGYPSNVKGWKSKFFFFSGDKWEIPEGTPWKGAPRVPRTWGIPDKNCNNPPRLYGDETKVFEEIFRLVEESGRFSVPVLLESKSFRRVFVSPGSTMSKRVSFKKIGEKLGKTASVISGTPAPAKGVVIGEKRPGESITSSPSKKGKTDDGSKGKGVERRSEGKKKATSSIKSLGRSSRRSFAPWGGDLNSPLYHSGPLALYLGQPVYGREVAEGVIPQADKEKVKKLTLDQTATKLFHVISQRWCSDRLWPSAAGRLESRHLFRRGELLQWKLKLLASRSLLPILNSNWLNPVLGNGRPLMSSPRRKGDRDSLADHLEKSGALVNELREALNKAKESAVEEFKSSSEFMVAVEDTASKYFGEGFDFCKVQLRWHHPDLGYRSRRLRGRSRFAGGARRDR